MVAVRFHRVIGMSSAIVLMLGCTRPALAQTDEAAPTVELVVSAGRSLKVSLDNRFTVKRVGQTITGTLVEPVYAYDRMVLPAGAKVRGHVAKLESPPRLARVRNVLSGDLMPHWHVVLQFDAVVLDDGQEIPLQTIVGDGIARLTRSVAATPEASEKGGVVARTSRRAKMQVREGVASAKQKAREAVSAFTQPGRMARLKDATIERLPYHPQFLSKGTIYQAELISPVDFGATSPIPRAAASARPAADSVLNARLVTPLDSAKTPRGTAIEAVVTQPVFSSDHRLILPEGSMLRGEVTFAKRARRLRRNGQLRFLFESVKVPREDPFELLAALYSVEASDNAHVAVDEEGGTGVTNPKTRFIEPALAILALGGVTYRGEHRFDGDADENVEGASVQSGNNASRALGGFLGLGVMGVGLSQISHPVGLALTAIGVARTVYTNLLAKGKEVSLLTDTSIQIRLAPERAPQP
jgi:hypothetical protein